MPNAIVGGTEAQMNDQTSVLLQRFSSVTFIDFEYATTENGQAYPLCMVVRDFSSGKTERYWREELLRLDRAPFDTGPCGLVVAYYASAEIGCFRMLGWSVPCNVVDLFTVFRGMTNGRQLPHGAGLLGAMSYFGIMSIAAEEKEEMRELAMRGGEYNAAERKALLDYCQTDVDALAALFPVMLPHFDLNVALLQGAYMTSLGFVEHVGVPLDLPLWERLRDNWSALRLSLVEQIDGGRYGVYDGETFKYARFDAWLRRAHIAWPRLASGKLDFKDDTFESMALLHPEVEPLHRLRSALAKLHKPGLVVGPDGRNRTILSAFRSKTGRNQPSNSKFIFGLSRGMRFLIRPAESRALAYIDYSQQEFGIAAALSGDVNMLAAYASGDCYMAFAIQAGAAPVGATKKTHGAIRDQYKRCVLAVQYLMGADSLARDMGVSRAHAVALLEAHKRTYATFWKWSEAVYNAAALKRRIVATFGWKMHITRETKPRTVYNFPMQANGAEMLRIAIILCIQEGIQVDAPVHDAILIEAEADKIDDAVVRAKACMERASTIVLKGFPLRTDVEVIRWPDNAGGKPDVVTKAILAFLEKLET